MPALRRAPCPAARLPVPTLGAPAPLPARPPAHCRGDIIEIKTWFQEDGKLAAQRDWVVTCQATGETIGRATSTWVMINMQVGPGGARGPWSLCLQPCCLPLS